MPVHFFLCLFHLYKGPISEKSCYDLLSVMKTERIKFNTDNAKVRMVDLANRVDLGETVPYLL